MTSTQIAPRTSDIHWSDEEKGVIKSVIAPGCTDSELRLFAYHCQRTDLDPFSKQIYAIKRGGKLTIQTSIDGLRSIAERTGQLSGSQRFWCGPDGDWKDVWLSTKPPSAAKCIVFRKGCDHPFIGIALFCDYNAGMGLWNKMPSTMLGKCAEAQALRAGFPACSGIYTTEEMDQADVKPIDVTSAPTNAIAGSDVKQVAARNGRVSSARNSSNVKPVEEAAEQSVVEATETVAAVVDVTVKEDKPVVTAPPSSTERLQAVVNRLSATGRRALLAAYKPICDAADIDAWLQFCSAQPDAHLAGLTEAAIAALNEGTHPKTGERLVQKPGRKPTSDQNESTGEEPSDDPVNPFA